MRADRWLRQEFPSLSNAFLQRQLRQRKIRLVPVAAGASSAASAALKPNTLLTSGMTVAMDAFLYDRVSREHTAPSPSPSPASSSHAAAVVEELLTRVLYEDANYVVLHKPPGLAVQDGSGLELSLAAVLPSLHAALSATAEQRDELRLVHRLDKETSGVLVLARHRLAAARFSALLRAGQLHKTYHALVSPSSPCALPPRGVLRSPVDGKPAVTHFRTLDARAVASSLPPLAAPTPTRSCQWLELRPVTGRKHQLRVHCATALGAPIVGDARYGGAKGPRLFLHASRLSFADPFDASRVIHVACAMDENTAAISSRPKNMRDGSDRIEV
ncbi:hypothetical protein P43SY_007708 [Pythium insidiosum]|uniref:Pseudouridine synthase RsuA/RluA-like domain-containing protein n=1 Tax=Pythium insidiosum TaxID=114742 RepID=A0AAD5Q8N9_PYTIN|nr:hypothetical protein P43SY_007708 [Pythium insidiosum]